MIGQIGGLETAAIDRNEFCHERTSLCGARYWYCCSKLSLELWAIRFWTVSLMNSALIPWYSCTSGA